MRLYIGPCGLGLGHITRCDMIARELSGKGFDVMFSSYLDGLDYLRRAGLRHFSALPISFRTREDGTIDPKLTATQNGVTVGFWKFVKQLVGEIDQIGTYGPDVVISDTRISTLIAGLLLRRPTCLIVNQYSVQMPNYTKASGLVDRMMLFFGKIIWKYATALLGLIWEMSDLIIVPDLQPPYTISRYNLAISKRVARKVRVVGPLARRTFPDGLQIKERVSRPFVFACVSGPATDRKYLVGLLSEFLKDLPADWELILSCGDPNGTSVPSQVGSLTIYEWMDENRYEETFDRADVIISRAGHGTIMRAVAKGKPLILIPPPNHTEQANNARRTEELGVGIVLDQANLSQNDLARAILDSLEKNSGRALELSRIVGSQGGIEVVAEAISELAGDARF